MIYSTAKHRIADCNVLRRYALIFAYGKRISELYKIRMYRVIMMKFHYEMHMLFMVVFASILVWYGSKCLFLAETFTYRRRCYETSV